MPDALFETTCALDVFALTKAQRPFSRSRQGRGASSQRRHRRPPPAMTLALDLTFRVARLDRNVSEPASSLRKNHCPWRDPYTGGYRSKTGELGPASPI